MSKIVKKRSQKKVIHKTKMSTPFSPEEAVQFLDDFQKLQSHLDETTKLISLRIPENILRQLKSRAKLENKKYQSMIVEYIRRGLS